MYSLEPGDLDDEALIQALADWSDGALEELYRRHISAVRRFARTQVFDREVAEEVVQELFLRLWDAPERFDPARGSLRTFLLTECRSRCHDRLRSDASRRMREVRAWRSASTRSVATDAQAIAEVDARHVRMAMLRLPAEERRAIALAFFGGHSYTDVAVLLGIPEGTAKGRIRSGLRRLRNDMNDAGPGTGA